MKAKHVRTGMKGEQEIMDLLIEQGYEVWYPDDNFCGDLTVYCPLEGKTWKVEVKTSNRNLDGAWNFCLYRAGKTDCRYADVVALVFKTRKETQIVFVAAKKVSHLKNMKFHAMPDSYKGKHKLLLHKELVSVKI